METTVTINVNTESLDEAIQKMSQLVKFLKETEQFTDRKPASNLLKEKKKTADNEQVMEILLRQLELLSEYSQKYLANIDSANISLAMKGIADTLLNYYRL